MIALLTGKPKISRNQLIIDVQGVGYAVHVGSHVQQKLIGEKHVQLFIYTHVREDTIELYGFLDEKEKEVFILLIGVSGVGPKTAINMFHKGADQVVHAVQNADVAFFKAIPRVGKKLAQKIIIELKSKLGSLKELNLAPQSQEQKDVAEALQGLGFSESDIQDVLQKIDVESMSIQEAITKSMRMLGK